MAPVKAPFAMAEQRARHEIARQRRTIDAHERRIGARTVGAHPAREDVLAGPALAAHQHDRVRRGRASGDLEELSKRPAVGLEDRRLSAFVELLLQLAETAA